MIPEIVFINKIKLKTYVSNVSMCFKKNLQPQRHIRHNRNDSGNDIIS
jgi:hypothetical protein